MLPRNLSRGAFKKKETKVKTKQERSLSGGVKHVLLFDIDTLVGVDPKDQKVSKDENIVILI